MVIGKIAQAIAIKLLPVVIREIERIIHDKFVEHRRIKAAEKHKTK